MMMRTWTRKPLAAMVALLAVTIGGPVRRAAAQDPAQAKTDYTPAEYNAYTNCTSEKNAQQRIKCLDSFVQSYPSSTLLIYVYRTYYQTYNELHNNPKLIEYADKELAFGDKLEPTVKLEALYLRSVAYYTTLNAKHPNPNSLPTPTPHSSQTPRNLLGEH